MKINNELLTKYLNENGKGAKAKLAYELGVSAILIEKIVTGNYPSIPNVALALKFAKLLNVTVEELFEVSSEAA